MPKRATKEPTAGVLDLDETAANDNPGAKAPSAHHHDLERLIRTAAEWMSIDAAGNIHVRGGQYCVERVVGKIHGEDTATILAGLILRFTELEERFAALEQELARSRNQARNLKKLTSFVQWVEGAEAIGDFDGLLGRAHAEIAKLEGVVDSTLATKQSLVERAEALADSTQWKSTAEMLDELMEAWKAAGSAGRAEDEALWERFRTARRSFANRRAAHFNELKRSRAQARDGKRDLIARATALASSTDWEATFQAMQELMDEWKQAGSAGKDIDDELWHHFRAAREPFFEARKAYQAAERQARPPRPPERGREAERPGDRRRDDRRPSGRGPGSGPSAPPARRPGIGGPGVLHASLAELVGPLRDLFPASRGEAAANPGRDDKDPTKRDKR